MLKTLLNMSISASYVILWVLALRFLMQKAPKKFSFFLWFIPLFRLLCPISFTSSVSAFKAIGATSQKGFVSYPVTGGTAVVNPPIFPSQITPTPVDIPVSETAQTFDFFSVLPYILAAIWILGAAAMLLRLAVSYFKLYRSVKACSKKIGDTLICTDLSAAFVMGFFRPVICLPEGLEGDEKEYVLLHEQTHIKRYDYISKLIFYFALCIHWFNPLVWLAYCLFSRDMEMSCDEAVIRKMGDGIKKSYSLSILALSAPSPLSFGQASAKERIVNIMKYKKPAVISVIIAVLAVSAAAVFLLSNPTADVPENSPYKHRTEYVGNNSKVGGIIYSLTFPEDMKYKNFELSENGVTVNFTSAGGSKYMDYNTSVPLRKNGAVMLSLIKNADSVIFRIEDGSETYDVECTREQTESVVGADLWSDTSSYEKFTALCSLIDTKYSSSTAAAVPADLYDALKKATLEYTADYAKNQSKVFTATGVPTVSHNVLGTEKKDNLLTVYSIGMCQYFDVAFNSGIIERNFCLSGPMAITFDTSKGGYEVTDYWMAQNAETFSADLNEVFPLEIRNKLTDAYKTSNNSGYQECYAQFISQNNVDFRPTLDSLLAATKITDPESYRYPGSEEPYSTEYLNMLYMGGYTVQYAREMFENNAVEEPYDYILAEAVCEILGIPYTADDPYEWYEQNRPTLVSYISGAVFGETPAIPDDLNLAIREAVLSRSSDYAMDGEYNAESHAVLRTDTETDTVTVYAIALALSFEREGDKISTVGGFHMPIVLTFDTSDGGYKLMEFWQPEDGDRYASSIAEKFPEDIAEEAMNLQNYATDLHSNCYYQYIIQKNIDWEPIIDALLEEICEPAPYSYYQNYIDDHEEQYRQLIYMGSYTLKYTVSMFENQPQETLELNILVDAASNIMGIHFDGLNPQKWYEQNLSSILLYTLDMNIKSENVTGTSLDFVIELHSAISDSEIYTGSAYTLEVYENGKYTDVQPVTSDNMVFISEAIIISEGENTIHTDWENFYGTLGKGKYRIGKEISVSNPDSSQRASTMFYAYFTIQ